MPVDSAWALSYYDPKGGPACTAVIAQSLEVKTTKKTLPQFHGKQANTNLHSHNNSNNLSINPQDLAGALD
jgi:hypothetical protein